MMCVCVTMYWLPDFIVVVLLSCVTYTSSQSADNAV